MINLSNVVSSINVMVFQGQVNDGYGVVKSPLLHIFFMFNQLLAALVFPRKEQVQISLMHLIFFVTGDDLKSIACVISC